jgi:hypothetical protein
LGWDEERFWRSTPRELINCYRGKYRNDEQKSREEWERIRWQTATLLMPHAKKGQSITPKTLLPFPWEVDAKPKLTRAEKLERLKKL